jgi:5-methylcytosine-specific restriction endonuclease McrA
MARMMLLLRRDVENAGLGESGLSVRSCYHAGVARSSPGRLQGAMDSVVLLLNSDYEPLNVCTVRRAFRLLFVEKAEVIQYDHHEIRTATEIFRAPSVIRLQHHIKRPRPRVRLSRREVFSRDKHTCQYCGRQTHDLTLDHVVPRHRGGLHTWDNLVAACKGCNHRKGGKLPDEARMRLMRAPFEPRCDVYTLFTPYLTDPRNDAWRDYLFIGRA